jgi:hypothetical protein
MFRVRLFDTPNPVWKVVQWMPDLMADGHWRDEALRKVSITAPKGRMRVRQVFNSLVHQIHRVAMAKAGVTTGSVGLGRCQPPVKAVYTASSIPRCQVVAPRHKRPDKHD